MYPQLPIQHPDPPPKRLVPTYAWACLALLLLLACQQAFFLLYGPRIRIGPPAAGDYLVPLYDWPMTLAWIIVLIACYTITTRRIRSFLIKYLAVLALCGFLALQFCIQLQEPNRTLLNTLGLTETYLPSNEAYTAGLSDELIREPRWYLRLLFDPTAFASVFIYSICTLLIVARFKEEFASLLLPKSDRWLSDTCPCGYNISAQRGHGISRCPECGHPIFLNPLGLKLPP